MHNDFLTPLAAHGAVTLVVLNQVDRLPERDVEPVLESLKGHPGPRRTGQGTGPWRVRPHGRRRGPRPQRHPERRGAAAGALPAAGRRRFAGLDAARGGLRRGGAAGVRHASKSRLTDELATAANVPVVVGAVARSYRLESTRRTGWPATRWLLRFRPDPLRRLNLRSAAPSQLNRTSLPPAGAPERARTDAAVREFADAASDGAPGPWRAAIRGAAREGREALPDALDQAIAGTDLMAARKSWWWGVFNVVQWLALLTAVGGLGWLGVLAGLAYFQMPVPEAPRVEGWPVPTLMIAGGVVLGIFLALAGKFIGAGAAEARAARARKRLQGCRGRCCARLVVEPVEVEVSRLRSFNAALKAAGGG